MEILKCEKLTKKFDKKIVLDNVDLVIPEDRIIGLLGQNGAGKTTLIKLVSGLLTPDDGSVLINGHEVGVESKRCVSYLPEVNYFDESMRVRDAINYFKDFYEDFDEEKAKRLLKELDLDINLKFSKMSKGMKEKVRLILVLSRDVLLYIFDEPLGGVDPATRDYILDTILNNFKEGSSVIISTHLISDIEHILDEVVFIDHGHIVLTSDADSLRSKENASIDEIFRRRFKC